MLGCRFSNGLKSLTGKSEYTALFYETADGDAVEVLTEEAMNLAANGVIISDTLVWTEGMEGKRVDPGKTRATFSYHHGWLPAGHL